MTLHSKCNNLFTTFYCTQWEVVHHICSINRIFDLRCESVRYIILSVSLASFVLKLYSDYRWIVVISLCLVIIIIECIECYARGRAVTWYHLQLDLCQIHPGGWKYFVDYHFYSSVYDGWGMWILIHSYTVYCFMYEWFLYHPTSCTVHK